MTISAVSATPFLEDASGLHGNAEQAFSPATVGELREIVAAAGRTKTPVTIAGAGTGLTGAAVPYGGWIVSLRLFRRLEIERGRARCGVGISLQELQNEAAKSGQFFGPNPTEYSASMGGIISTNAGGARTFGFRSVRHHVLGMEVTFMDGSTRWVVKGEKPPFPFTAVRQPATRKNSAGYYLQPDTDWISLLAGSEGTLGIITEVEVALLPIAPAILSGVVFFETDEAALDAVDEWRAVARLRLLEYLDGPSLDFMRDSYPDIPLPARAALLVEQDLASDTDTEIDEWAQRLAGQRAMEEDSWFGLTAADRERFARFRHALAASVVDRVRRGGLPKIGTDFAVPIEQSREMIGYYRTHCAKTFAKRHVIFGHIGDANVHLNVFPETPAEAQEGEELMLDFAKHALALGGTVAAEHGIGKNKRDLFRLMYAPQEIEAMREVKRRLDRDWLLGRGTIFEGPEESRQD